MDVKVSIMTKSKTMPVQNLFRYMSFNTRPYCVGRVCMDIVCMAVVCMGVARGVAVS